MMFNIDLQHFIKLKRAKIGLDALFLLEKMGEGMGVGGEIECIAPLQWLDRKGFIADGKITPLGEELLANVVGTQELEVGKEKRIEKGADSFEQWWSIYPSTDHFQLKNRTFQGTQKKNIKKEECRKRFIVLCTSYSAEEIIRATKYHINTAKELSLKKGSNQLSFIPNSERYLREKCFEPYISISLKKSSSSGDAVVSL